MRLSSTLRPFVGAEKKAAGLLTQAEGQAATLRANVEQELRQTRSQLDDLRARLDELFQGVEVWRVVIG